MRCLRAVRAIGLFLLIAAVFAWLLTGRAVYTRFPDARRRAVELVYREDERLWPQATPLGVTRVHDMFPNRFMLGLLPSGSGKYVLSLATVAFSVIVILLVIRVADRRKPEHNPPIDRPR